MVSDDSNRNVIALEGAVSIHVAGDLLRRAKAAAGEGRNVALDCRRVEFIDTAALQILIALGRALADRGCSLETIDAPPSAKHIFLAAGIAEGAAR